MLVAHRPLLSGSGNLDVDLKRTTMPVPKDVQYPCEKNMHQPASLERIKGRKNELKLNGGRELCTVRKFQLIAPQQHISIIVKHPNVASKTTNYCSVCDALVSSFQA